MMNSNFSCSSFFVNNAGSASARRSTMASQFAVPNFFRSALLWTYSHDNASVIKASKGRDNHSYKDKYAKCIHGGFIANIKNII